MHVITRSRLREFWERHPEAKPGLMLWYKIAALAQWQSFTDLRLVFPSADLVGNLTIFNISGNRYRLIALVDYRYKKVFIRHVLTHADYTKENWKKDSWIR